MIDILKMLCKMSLRYRAVRPLEAFYTLSATGKLRMMIPLAERMLKTRLAMMITIFLYFRQEKMI